MKSKYLLTKASVIVGISLSVVSYFISGNSKDLYPFFHWKLYTQPSGSKHSVTEYRIFTKSHKDKFYQRRNIEKVNGFTDDEYYYMLNHLVQRSMENTHTPQDTARLKTFVKFIYPEALSARIVAETYDPLEIIHYPDHYDTSTVIQF